MIEYKSDGLVVFVTSVGGGGSGEGGGSGGQMHPASLEKLVTREDELEAENSRLREAFQNYLDHVGCGTAIRCEHCDAARAALKEKE